MSQMLSCTQFHFCRESRRDASRGSIPVMAARLSNDKAFSDYPINQPMFLIYAL